MAAAVDVPDTFPGSGGGGAPREDADMPWHARSVVIMKKHARRVLEPLLAADAEVLTCECDEADELSLAHP